MNCAVRSYRTPPDVRLYVNAFPPELSADRCLELLTDYLRERDTPSPASPPRWYIDAVIAALEARVADLGGQR